MDKVIGLSPTHACPVTTGGLLTSHQGTLQETLIDCFRRQQFCDVTVEVSSALRTHPTVILAHRVVLAAKSPHLKTLFSGPQLSFGGSRSNLSRAPSSQSNSSRKSSAYFSKSSSEGEVNIIRSTEDLHSLFRPAVVTLKITNATPHAVQLVVEYAYTGKLLVTADNVREVFDAGQAMGMNCVLEKCRLFLDSRPPDVTISLLVGLHEHGSPGARFSRFQEMLFGLCEEKFEAMMSSSMFCTLPFELIQELLQSSRLCVYSEEQVFQGVMKWLHRRHESLPRLEQLMGLVRLPMLSPEFLIYCVQPLLSQLNTQRFHFQLNQALCHHSKLGSRVHLHDNNGTSDQFLPRNYADQSATMLYSFGGHYTDSHDQDQAVVERLELRVDSTASRSWAPVSCCGTLFRRHAAIVSSGSVVYVLGGLVGEDASDAANVCDVGSAGCDWHALPSMLAPRESTAATVHHGDVYAIGGCTAGQTLDLVERYSWRLSSWLLMAPLSAPRAASGAASTASFVFAVGGCCGGEALSSVECFNVIDNEWHTLAPMSQKRSSPAVVILGSKLLVLGGFDGIEALRSCEAWDLTSQTWRPFPAMNRARACATAVVCNELVIVVGGHDDCHALSCGETFNPATEQWTLLPAMSVPRGNCGLLVKEGSASRETLC